MVEEPAPAFMAFKMRPMRPAKYNSLYPDETDDRIHELEREVSSLRKKLKNQKEAERIDIEDMQSSITFQKEIDLLEIALRKQKRKYSHLEEEANLLRTEVEMLNKALNSPALKEENLVEMMMQQLENRTDELHMSRMLIMELQNVAFSEHVDDKIIAQAKSVLYDNNYLKKRVMEMEVELMKSERKMNEIAKHSDLVDRVQGKQKNVIIACKKKLQELAKEKDTAVEEVEKHYEKKESMRLAQEKYRLELMNVQVSDLQSRLHVTEISSSSRTLPPLTPHGTDALLVAEMRTEIEAKDDLINELKTQLSDLGERSGKSSSSSSSKRQRGLKLKNAELMSRNTELEGEMKVLREKLKSTTEITTQEINELREQKKRLAFLLQHVEMQPDDLNLLRTEMETQTQILEKKLEQKEKGIERLHSTLRSMSKSFSENDDPKLVEELKSKNRELVKENHRIAQNYQTELVKRKKYYNLYEDLKGKIRVYVRVRPLLTATNHEKNAQSCIACPDVYSVKVSLPKRQKDFVFDRVFQPEEDQAAVFGEVSSLIQSAVDGYCVSIFAYGQTGSGKTFTLLGEGRGDREGVAPRSFNKIFEIFEEQKKQFDFTASVYMLELYNDQLIDLLLLDEETKQHNQEPPLLEIKRDNKNMIFVQNAIVKEVTSAEDMMKIYSKGITARHVSDTKMNATSSRSHLIITVLIESMNKTTGQTTRGKLSVVDLAGSERICKSTATPEKLKETNSINLSLSALGDVVSALTSEQTYVPYRNNKLTMLLQDCLGGNSKTLMFVNVSPADQSSNESLYSLSYGARVKLIKNAPSKITESEQAILLRKEIDSLKQEVGRLKDQLSE